MRRKSQGKMHRERKSGLKRTSDSSRPLVFVRTLELDLFGRGRGGRGLGTRPREPRCGGGPAGVVSA